MSPRAHRTRLIKAAIQSLFFVFPVGLGIAQILDLMSIPITGRAIGD
jgi:hypothetical protein